MKSLILLALAAIAFSAPSMWAQDQGIPAELAVAESKLGTSVVDREIATEATAFAVNDRVYLWMKITGGPADSVAVTWTVDDDTWSTNLSVGASTWRTWAYKTLWKAGQWKVAVTDQHGNLLLEKTFSVTP